MVQPRPVAAVTLSDQKGCMEFCHLVFPFRIQDACDLGAPQFGFSAIIWQMRSRISFDVGLLPRAFKLSKSASSTNGIQLGATGPLFLE